MAREYYQIKNLYPNLKKPERYTSEKKVITCRSSWETKFVLKWLDVHQDIIEWSSEELIIPYLCPVRHMTPHRYFPDYLVKMKDRDGKIIELLIEIKPEQERYLIENLHTFKPKRMTQSAKEKIETAVKNRAKWEAANAYCLKEQQKGRNLHFVVITEKNSPVPFV